MTAFDTVEAFWAMGEHGYYVWVSYGVWFVSLSVLLVQSMVARRRVRAQMHQYYEDQES